MCTSKYVFSSILAVALTVFPTFSADFHFISFRDSANGSNSEIYHYAAGVQTRITFSSTVEEHPVLSSGNNLVYFVADVGPGFSEIFSMTPTGTSVTQVTTDGGVGSFNGNSHVFLAPDQLSLFITTSRTDGSSIIRRVSLNGVPLGIVVDHGTAEVGHSPAVATPDGYKLYYASNMAGNFEIYRSNLDGSNQQQLTNNSVYDSGATPSVDGTTVAFARADPFNPCVTHIMLMNHNGTGQTQVTSASDLGLKWPFARDGQNILYVSNEAGHQQIFLISSNGTGKTLLVTSSADEMHLLPDSKCGFNAPDLTVNASPRIGAPGTTVTYTVDPHGAVYAKYIWKFGDNTTVTTTGNPPPTMITHQYIAPNTYQGVVTAQDSCGPPPNENKAKLPPVEIGSLLLVCSGGSHSFAPCTAPEQCGPGSTCISISALPTLTEAGLALFIAALILAGTVLLIRRKPALT